jgi:RHS repeat-associated protein
MLDERGKTAWSADIDVYGELQNVVGERGACPFRWPGQYEDEETGLYYNRFRYYDPEAGGYVSQDPIGLKGGPALYAYVTNPLAALDPLGLAATGCGSSSPAEVDWDPKTGRFRDKATGRFIKRQDVPWPANDGFLSRKPDTLTPGMHLDRYGTRAGNFLAPEGTPFPQRGLPKGYEAGKPYESYEVVKPYNQVESGPIAPTPQFGSPGGGGQYKTAHTVQQLVDMGVLKPL